MKIFKQILPYKHGSIARIFTSINGQLLSIKNQYNNSVAYYTTDDMADQEWPIEIIAATTGSELKFGDNYKFIDTVMLEDGHYVVHYFQKMGN